MAKEMFIQEGYIYLNYVFWGLEVLIQWDKQWHLKSGSEKKSGE